MQQQNTLRYCLFFCSVPSSLPAFLFTFSIFSFHPIFFAFCSSCLASSPCLHPFLFLSFLLSSLPCFFLLLPLFHLIVSFPFSSSKTNKLLQRSFTVWCFFCCLTLQEPLRNNLGLDVEKIKPVDLETAYKKIICT